MLDHDSFMYHLNEQLTERERIFKLSSDHLEKSGILIIAFIINAEDYDKYLDHSLKQKVKSIATNITHAKYDLRIIFEKTFTSSDYVKRLLHDYLYHNAALLYPQVTGVPISVDLDVDVVRIEMTLAPYLCDYMINSGINERLISHLNSKIMESVVLDYIPDPAGDPNYDISIVQHTTPLDEFSIRTVPVIIGKSIINAILHDPVYIRDVNSKESKMECVSGIVSSFRQALRKQVPLPYFTFKLNDGTGSIHVKYFPKTEKHATLFSNNVSDAVQICVEGPIRYDDFAGGYSVTLYRASECVGTFEKPNTKPIKSESVQDRYYYIIPKPFVNETQLDLFSSRDKKIPNLINKEIVVFDFETTGLTPGEAEIIEIGAVKIINAELVETFSSFVRPKNKIPPAITELTGITENDVRTAPEWREIVGDFFKFTKDVTLAAHNAKFDMLFLRHFSESIGYAFNNDVIDTLALAQSKLNLSNYKLGTILKHLGIHNPAAHRAIHDAISTAKMLIRLASM
ncbi:MAG: 3'-5' exoribonuclease [Christensenellaceae bacterium]|jgi:DNA polymerase III epsilon subunit family exonuclease|nr:3'-5' exoribonuclease [Christensenellaceae bacterium]